GAAPGRLAALECPERLRRPDRRFGRGPGMRIRLLVILLASLAATPAWTQSSEASWPSKPIRFIVPFPPGAAVDGVARLMGQHLSSRLGQQLIIDNRVGASGSVGALAIARATPD